MFHISRDQTLLRHETDRNMALLHLQDINNRLI